MIVHDAGQVVHAEITTVHGKVTTVHGKVTAVHGEVTTVHGEVTVVHGEVTVVHGEVTVVHGEVTVVHGEVTVVHGEVTVVLDPVGFLSVCPGILAVPDLRPVAHPLASLNRYLWKYRTRLMLGSVFVAASNLLAIIPAQLVRHSFDLVREGISLHQLYAGTAAQQAIYGVFGRNIVFYGALIVALAVARGVLLFFMRQTIIVMSRLIENDLKNEIYDHYQSLPLAF